MRKSWRNLRRATTPCVSEQRVSRGSRYCRRPAHPTRSSKTSVGSAPAGAPLVPSCRAPVYGRRACGLSAELRRHPTMARVGRARSPKQHVGRMAGVSSSNWPPSGRCAASRSAASGASQPPITPSLLPKACRHSRRRAASVRRRRRRTPWPAAVPLPGALPACLGLSRSIP